MAESGQGLPSVELEDDDYDDYYLHVLFFQGDLITAGS